MNMYNLVHGFHPGHVFLLPMLGRKMGDYPRYRDCFASKDQTCIEVYTRVGGSNRGQGYGEEELYEDPNFVTTYDYKFDRSYGVYVFNVPKQWRADFDRVLAGSFESVSDEYIQLVKDYYPSIASDIDILFEAYRRQKEN